MYIWIGIIAQIKVMNIAFGIIDQKRFVSVHSMMNKITGCLLFAVPLTVGFVELRYSVVSVCVVATFAAIQEGHCIKTGIYEEMS